jgi:acylphosphatase
MTDREDSRLHAIIEGRVQGVGFRAFTMRKANEMGIDGWVRNLRDGSVEVIAEGQRTDLDKLLSALRRGPASAYVTKVKPDWRSATGEFDGFNAKYTL